MDGKQGPHAVPPTAVRGDDGLQDVLAVCARTLRDLRPAEGIPGLLERCRRLEELNSALDAVLTRLQLAVVLDGCEGVTSRPGSSPMHSQAVERLRRAVNVIARGDT